MACRVSDTLSDTILQAIKMRRVTNRKNILVGTLLGLSLSSIAIGKEPATMQMGDGTVHGERLADYEITWLQCSIGQDGWVSGGALTESLVATGDVLRVTQRAARPNGIASVAVTYFDRSSLAPPRRRNCAPSWR